MIRAENSVEKMCNLLMLLVVLFIMVFTPLCFGTVTVAPFYIVHVAVLLLLFLWVLKMVFTRRFQLISIKAQIPALIFVVYSFVMYLFSDLPYDSRNEFLKILDYAILYIVLINNFYRKKYICTMLFGLFIVALLLSCLAGVQYLKHSDYVKGVGLKQELYQGKTGGVNDQEIRSFLTVISKESPEQYDDRASGTFVCPNHLAGYLEMIFPLALVVCLYARFVMGVRLFIGYSFLVMLMAWVLTFSRGGWLAGASALGFFFVMLFFRDDNSKNNFKPVFFIVTLLVGLAIITSFVKPIQERVLSIKPTGDASIGTRLDIWVDAINMIKEKPVLGFGPGAFVWRYPQYKNHPVRRRITYTHNDYLNLLVDYGVVGFAIVLAFFLMQFARIKRLRSLVDYPDRQSILMGTILSLVAVMVHAAFDFNSHIYSNALLLIFIVSMLTVCSYNIEKELKNVIILSKINGNLFLSVLTGLVLFCCILLGMYHGSRLLFSEILYHEGIAYQSSIMWDKSLQRYKKAQVLDPSNHYIYAKIADVISAKNIFRKTENEDPITYYDMALKHNPYESDYMFKKAMLLKRRGDFKGACDLLKDAVAQEPTNIFYESELKKAKKLIQNK